MITPTAPPSQRIALVAGSAWFAVSLTTLAGIAPLLLVLATPRAADSSSAWKLAWLVAVVAGSRYAWIVASAPRRLYELSFWLFTYVFLGLAPMVQMRTANYPATTPDTDPDLNRAAMLVVIVGVVAFMVGAWSAGRRRQEPTAAGRGERGYFVSPHRTYALTAFALLAASYYLVKVGAGPMFTTRAARSVREVALWPNFTVQGIVRAASTLPLVVAFAALMRMRRERALAGRHGPVFMPVAVLLALLVMVNPISTPRYVSGTALLSVAVAIGAVATLLRSRIFVLLLALGLVFVFPYAAFARNPPDERQATATGPADALASGDFDAFDQVNNVVAYVRDNGTTHGGQVTGAVLFFVPRGVWSSKPDDTGALLADYRGYKFTNLSAPLWAELFVDGGWLLLFGGMLLVGFLLRRFDDRATVRFRAPPDPRVLAGILPFYLVIVLRGSLLQAMSGLALLVACGLFVINRRATELDPVCGPVTAAVTGPASEPEG